MQTWRTTLAVLLSMAVFVIYSVYFAPKPPALSPAAVTTQNGTSNESAKPSLPVDSVATALVAKEGTLTNLTKGTAADKKSHFENDKLKVSFVDGWASVQGWILKNFHETTSDESPAINLLGDKEDGNALYFTLGNDSFDKQALFSKQSGFEFKAEAQGLSVQKRFIFSEKDSHLVDIEVDIQNSSSVEQSIDPRLWIIRDQKDAPDESGIHRFFGKQPDMFYPEAFVDGKLISDLNVKKLGEKVIHTGRVYWTGLSDRYFLLSIIARQESDKASVQYGKLNDNKLYTSLSYSSVKLAAGEKKTIKYSAYFGEKKRESLQALGVQLEQSINYGWFSFLAHPILWLLMFFEKWIGNWGLAVIALTFFIKILLHPINKKSMESMKAMQKIQPLMSALREKYKDNREKLNLEMMQLMKTHKVNPMGGCLPMLIQMPVYITLYKVLWNAVELYHTPFFWFYKDLSAPDPYFISPVILGVMMYLQQKLTPSAASVDPMQQKMMSIMPIMFSAFMLFLPFGLVLYILVNTSMSVIQQAMLHRELTFVGLIKRALSKV